MRSAIMTRMGLIWGVGAAWLVACGSEIGPPPGWQGLTPEIIDDAPGTLDASEDTGPPECAVDEDCEGKFSVFPCQFPKCDAGECTVGKGLDGTVCDDGDACTEGEYCETGICVPQQYLSCDDGDACTDDSCDRDQQGCVHTPKSQGFCNDGLECTIGDGCVNGECVGTPTSDCYTGSCCSANETPGCEDQAVRQCVCASEPQCCALEGSWSGDCVDLVLTASCGFCADVGCGDGVCADAESCSTCPADCGLCSGCGDGTCADEENCFNCYLDCGECGSPVCGDTLCKAPSEDCQTCEPDCGECSGAVCGDGTCELDEHCQNCSADCGECKPGCGDGVCTVAEGCQECPLDCGVCVGNCCTERDQPGCDQQLIEQCVCGADDYCCNGTWDGVCVAQVETEGCAECSGVVCGDGLCTPDVEDCESCEQDCGDCIGACCQVQTGPGCGSAAVEACVCAQDSYCCATSWDSICVDEVEEFGCGNCTSGSSGSGGGSGSSTCCSTSASAGCNDAAIEACVCMDFANIDCCWFEWSAGCVQAVSDLGCGTCP